MTLNQQLVGLAGTALGVVYILFGALSRISVHQIRKLESATTRRSYLDFMAIITILSTVALLAVNAVWFVGWNAGGSSGYDRLDVIASLTVVALIAHNVYYMKKFGFFED